MKRISLYFGAVVLALLCAAQAGAQWHSSPIKGPGNTDAAARGIAALKDAGLDTLDADTAALGTDTRALSKRMYDLSGKMDTLGDALLLPGKIQSDLDEIISMLNSARTAARLLANVEATAVTANRFLSSSEPALRDLQAADQKAAAIAAVTDPLGHKAKSLSIFAKAASVYLDGVAGTVLDHEPDVTYCVRYSLVYAGDNIRPCIQANADALAAEADALVVDVDKVIKPLLASYSLDAPAIKGLQDFVPNFAPLQALLRDAEALKSALKPVCDELKRLEGDIKIDLGVYTIKVPIGKILDTALDLEDYIKHKVSGVIWDAAKLFGINKLLDKLVSEAESVAKEVTRNINFNLNLGLNVNALGDLAPKLPQLTGVFPGSLPIPEIKNFWRMGDYMPGKAQFEKLGADFMGAAGLCYTGNRNTLELFAPTLGCR